MWFFRKYILLSRSRWKSVLSVMKTWTERGENQSNINAKKKFSVFASALLTAAVDDVDRKVSMVCSMVSGQCHGNYAKDIDNTDDNERLSGFPTCRKTWFLSPKQVTKTTERRRRGITWFIDFFFQFIIIFRCKYYIRFCTLHYYITNIIHRG